VSCDELAGLLLDLARGAAMAPEDRDRARAHAASCASCGRRLEQEERLSDALRALADRGEGNAAPAWVEARLREALRGARPKTAPRGAARRPDRWRWATVAAAAASLAAASLLWRREPPKPPPAPAEWMREAAEGEDEGAFLPVTFDDALVGLDAVQVVRVRLPRSAVGSLGLAVTNDFGQGPVEADVLVGHDGLPRAIRLVSVSPESSSMDWGETLEEGGRR
jgi:hypothetical protein